jgi:hypothetical protein
MNNLTKLIVVLLLLLLIFYVLFYKKLEKGLELTPTKEDVHLLNELFPSGLDTFIAKEDHNWFWSRGMTYTAYWTILKQEQFDRSLDQWTTVTDQQVLTKVHQPSWMLKASSHNNVFRLRSLATSDTSHSVYCFTLDIPQDQDDDQPDRVQVFITINPRVP